MSRQGSELVSVALARAGEVEATIGYLPAAVAGALSEALYNMHDHHKRRVLKGHRLPGGLAATRFLASRFFIRGRRTRDVPVRIADAEGESFMAAASGETFGPSALRQLEEGGDIASGALMAVPVDEGRVGVANRGSRTSANFRRLLSQRRLRIIPARRGGKAVALLVNITKERRVKGELRRSRPQLVGVLVRRRRQGRMLGFHAAFDSVAPRHLARLERVLTLGMTAAGRIALEREGAEAAGARSAARTARAAHLAGNPADFAGARKAAVAAARLARGGGGDG